MPDDSRSIQAEKMAFNKMSAKLGHPEAFATPAGVSTGFPDFGFRIQVNGKSLDIHVEYKMDQRAQMGSMRDWYFDGSKFYTKDKSIEKETMIAVMNNSQVCVTGGKVLLNDFRKLYDPRVKEIYSGMLSIESDTKLRRAKLINFANNTKSYQLCKIKNPELGQGVINHYVKKFNNSLVSGAAGSFLLFMIGDQLYKITEKGNITTDDKHKLQLYFDSKPIPILNKMDAKLEVRIQPRGLSGPNKPVRIDVMASFRLDGSIGQGLKV